MGKGRVEAFSDGVIAILITIMVLEMKVAQRNWKHTWSVILYLAALPAAFVHVAARRCAVRRRGDHVDHP
ncbi:MAG: TMEM175 family protein [Betaproteobacteria bacterium]